MSLRASGAANLSVFNDGNGKEGKSRVADNRRQVGNRVRAFMSIDSRLDITRIVRDCYLDGFSGVNWDFGCLTMPQGSNGIRICRGFK